MDTAVSTGGNPDVADQLFREAKNMYNTLPEFHPTKNRELLDEFSQCVSTNDIMLALEKRITALKDFRNDRWLTIREKLKPVVDVALLVIKIVGSCEQSIVRLHWSPFTLLCLCI